MKPQMNRDLSQKCFTVSVYVMGVVLALSGIFYLAKNGGSLLGILSSAARPLVYAVVFAYLLWYCVHFLENTVFPKITGKKEGDVKARRIVAIALTYLLLILLVVLLINSIIPQIAESITTLQDRLLSFASRTADWYSNNFEEGQFMESTIIPEWLKSVVNDVMEKMQEYISSFATMLSEQMTNIISQATTYVKSVATFMVELKNILLGLVFSVYFLIFKENITAQMKKLLHAVFSDTVYGKIRHYVKLTDEKVGGFLIAKIIDSAIVGVLCFFAMLIFGMPYAPLISVIIGITNIIPFFGPFIGAIPSALIILIADPGTTIGFLILIVVLQQLDGNVIGPKILGDRVGLNPLWIIIAISIMGSLFGFFGMFLGVPLFAVFYSIVKELAEMLLEKKGLPVTTEDYYNPTDRPYLTLTKSGEGEKKSLIPKKVRELCAKLWEKICVLARRVLDRLSKEIKGKKKGKKQ